MTNDRLSELLLERKELLSRIKGLQDRFHEADFDAEDMIPGHDTTTPHLIENHIHLYLIQLKQIEKQLLSLGWRPNQKQ